MHMRGMLILQQGQQSNVLSLMLITIRDMDTISALEIMSYVCVSSSIVPSGSTISHRKIYLGT